MGGEEGGPPDRRATPVSAADVVRVLSRALSERPWRIHLTSGQRRAILGQPPSAPEGGRA